VLSVFNKTNPAVSNYGKQAPPSDIGVEAFEFWCPERRPRGQNLALQIEGGLAGFGVDNLRNGVARPTHQPNAWVADWADEKPTLTLEWPTEQVIGRVELGFDADFDHPLETVLMTHPETVMPFCPQAFVLCNDRKERLYEKTDNHQARHTIVLDPPVRTRALHLHLRQAHAHVAVSMLEVRVYGK
jgi:hypothetical protein